MRLTIDECLAPIVAALLVDAGHDAVHVSELNLLGRPDTDVMVAAQKSGRVVVSADTDFGELLATSGDSLPSIVLLRRSHEPVEQTRAIISALPDIETSLTNGAIAVLTRDRVSHP